MFTTWSAASFCRTQTVHHGVVPRGQLQRHRAIVEVVHVSLAIVRQLVFMAGDAGSNPAALRTFVQHDRIRGFTGDVRFEPNVHIGFGLVRAAALFTERCAVAAGVALIREDRYLPVAV